MSGIYQQHDQRSSGPNSVGAASDVGSSTAEPPIGPDSEDAVLLEAVARGDPDALGLLYERHSRFAFAIACRMVGDRQAAEDIVHEAFIAVWRGARTFRPSLGGARPWLLTIVRRKALDHLRTRQPIPFGDAEPPRLPAAATDDPGDLVAALTDAERVRGLVATLPSDQRLAVGLAFFAGMTHAEIAERFGLPLGTVKGRVRLGLAKLRPLLSDLAPPVVSLPSGVPGSHRP